MTFGTLIDALVASGSAPSCQRALRLWAEMRSLSLKPDAAIMLSLLTASQRLERVRLAGPEPRHACIEHTQTQTWTAMALASGADRG